MTQEICLIDWCRALIIEYYEVVVAITFKIIGLDIVVDMTKALINPGIIDVVVRLSNKKCLLCTAEHIAVHTVGSQHNPVA